MKKLRMLAKSQIKM